MDVTNPRYTVIEHRAFVQLDIDGKTATIGMDTKPTMHYMGYIPLGSDFEDMVPPIRLTAKEIKQRTGFDTSDQVLEGFTDNPEVVHWQRQLFYDCENGLFKEGPAKFREIPDKFLVGRAWDVTLRVTGSAAIPLED